MYAISRINEKPGVWCWRVAYRERGKRRYKSFYDLKLGGTKPAKLAAVAWRNRQLAKRSVITMREFRQIPRTSNQSGEPGVLLVRDPRMPGGIWQARLKLPGGRQITKSFGVRRHGYKSAFRLAVAARIQMLSLVEDTPFLHHPTAKRFARLPNQG